MPNNSPVNITNVNLSQSLANISNNDKKVLSDVRLILNKNKDAASIEKKENEWLLQKKDPKRTLPNSALDDKLRTSIDKAYRQLFTGRYTTARDELVKEYDQLIHASRSLDSLYPTLSASNDDIYDLQLDLDIQLNIMRQIISNKWSGGKRLRRRATRAKRRRSKNKSRRR
jgi:hypothetical protein